MARGGDADELAGQRAARASAAAGGRIPSRAAAVPVGHQQLSAFDAVPLDVVVPPVTTLVAPSFTVTLAPAQAVPLLLAIIPLREAARLAALVELMVAALISAY